LAVQPITFSLANEERFLHLFDLVVSYSSVPSNYK